jgi:hypothetical protein
MSSGLRGHSLPMNLGDMNQKNDEKDAAKTSSHLLDFRLGWISDINDDNQVKVRFSNGDFAGTIPSYGSYLPLMNSLGDIQARFGTLRKGLLTRVWWYKGEESKAIAEVVASDDTDPLKQAPADQKGVGVHKLLAPGFM